MFGFIKNNPVQSAWYGFSIIAITLLSLFTDSKPSEAEKPKPQSLPTPIVTTILPTPTVKTVTILPTPTITTILPTPITTTITILPAPTILPTPTTTSTTIIIPPTTPPPSISATSTPSPSSTPSSTRTPRNHANGLVCFILVIKDKDILIKVPCPK